MKAMPVNANILALNPYVPGKPIEELAREYGLNPDTIIKLASNENPLGMSAQARKVIEQVASQVNFYPDGNSFDLKQALAHHYQLTTEQIVLGNGSNDVLDLIARVFLNDQKAAIFSEYAFAVYPIVTQLQAAKAIVTPAKNWGHDLDAMLSAITDQTSVIFIANPNNPTGTLLTKTDIENFLTKVPNHIIVVLDEAYAEYLEDEENYPCGIDYLARYSNLIVTRTFSKIYGLAGLRIGYGLCTPEIADLLNRARQPFNINLIAQSAAIAALNDQDFVEQAKQVNQAGLLQLTQAFEQLAIDYIPSKANFISFAFKTAEQAKQANETFMRQGVIVRPLAGYQMPQYLRVSVGTTSQNARFIKVLTEIVNV